MQWNLRGAEKQSPARRAGLDFDHT